MEITGGRDFGLTCTAIFDAGYNGPVARGKGKKLSAGPGVRTSRGYHYIDKDAQKN